MLNSIKFLVSIFVMLIVSIQSAYALSDAEKSHLRRVNVYFNTLDNMEGNFIQIDPRGRESAGRFFLSRPGKIRFEYKTPQKSAVVSDGSWVSIQDDRGNFVDRYPLVSTPLKFLLRDRVDLLKDAAIQNVNISDSFVSVTLAAKRPVTPGSLTLNFNLPNYTLSSWSVLDAKGNTTRIAIGDLKFGQQYKSDLFKAIESKKYNASTGKFE